MLRGLVTIDGVGDQDIAKGHDRVSKRDVGERMHQQGSHPQGRVPRDRGDQGGLIFAGRAGLRPASVRSRASRRYTSTLSGSRQSALMSSAASPEISSEAPISLANAAAYSACSTGDFRLYQ